MASLATFKAFSSICKVLKSRLDFGVEKVIWIMTASQKVMVATADQDWIISDWSKPITLMPGVVCSLAELLAKRGVE